MQPNDYMKNSNFTINDNHFFRRIGETYELFLMVLLFIIVLSFGIFFKGRAIFIYSFEFSLFVSGAIFFRIIWLIYILSEKYQLFFLPKEIIEQIGNEKKQIKIVNIIGYFFEMDSKLIIFLKGRTTWKPLLKTNEYSLFLNKLNKKILDIQKKDLKTIPTSSVSIFQSSVIIKILPEFEKDVSEILKHSNMDIK